MNFLSDHRPILLKLTRNYNFSPNKIIKDIQVCKLKRKTKRKTSKNSLGKDFASRLTLETNKISKIPVRNESDTNCRSKIEHTLGEIQNALYKVSRRSLKKKIIENWKKHIKDLPKKKWFDLNCKQIRTNMQPLERRLSKTPKDP